MKITVDAQSFVPSQTQEAGSAVTKGVVTVWIGDTTKTMQAAKFTKPDGDCEFWVKGFGGRYSTSAKVWPATLTVRVSESGETSMYARFGRDDRDPKFNKLNAIFPL